jgi:putative flippase GtrA
VIDYALMNILMFMFHINQGTGFVFIKIFSITIAVIFSYYMNLFFTFKLKRGEANQLIKFVLLSGITIIVNVLIASYLVDSIDLSINKYL